MTDKTTTKPLYIFDSSSFNNLQFYERKYQDFKKYWMALETLISDKQLYVPGEVIDECRTAPPIVRNWLMSFEDQIVYENDEVYKIMRDLIKDHPSIAYKSMVKQKSYHADPIIIALARYFNRRKQEAIIVTDESYKKSNSIPNIAKKYDIQCFNLLELLKAIGVLK